VFPSRSIEYLEQSLQVARRELEGFCMEQGRDADAVQLLPVTKAVDADTTANLYALGEREFAENRADALVAKSKDLADRGMQVRWHFIGPLQRNKARRVVQNAEVLHSVHSLALIETLARIAAEENRELDLYLQVHLSGDESKQGLAAEQLEEAAQRITDSPHLSLVGLMAMGPLEDSDGIETERVFRLCSELGKGLEGMESIQLKYGSCRYSMGMSRDLRQAVAAGTTLVRIGTALYQ